MASTISLQSTDSSFNDPLTVPPWKVLVDNICNNLDDYTFEKFLFFSKDRLGAKLYEELAGSKSPLKYFSCLEDICGENGAVDHIEHIVNIDEFHGNLGQTNYSEEIRRYRQEKIHYLEECAKKGWTIDENFVGRELIIEDIFGYLRGEFKGVVICGMGGIGKTSLAGQICYKMKYTDSKWSILPVSLREVKSCEEFLEQLVVSLGNELNVDDQVLCVVDVSSSNLKTQLKSLLGTLHKEQKNILYLIDNIDDMVDTEVKKHEFYQTMRDVLNMITSNVKFLLTSRKKISNVTDHANEKAYLFDKSMIEIELKALNEDNTARMLRKLSHTTDQSLNETACKQLFELCDGIPLAVSMVAGQIKDGYPVDRMIGYMKSQPRDSLINNVISSTLKKMEMTSESFELKRLLVRLSVFQTAAFDIKACTDICRDKLVQERETFSYAYKDKTEEDKRWVQLASLKSLFLLEIDHVLQFRHQRDHLKKSYSLHPMVYDHLNLLCKTEDKWNYEREEAKQNFIEYFCKHIQKRGEKIDKSFIEVRQFIENSKVHIKKWFYIIRKEKCSLRKYFDEDKQRKPHLVACHCIMKIAERVISHREKGLFAVVQADISKTNKDLYLYMYWMCVKSECKINENRLQLAEEILNNLSTELGMVANETQCMYTKDWNLTKEDEMPAWGIFYSVKSLLYHRLCQNEHKTILFDRALEVLNIADEIFSGKAFRKLGKIVVKCFIKDRADVKNLKGCIHFLKEELKVAMQCHQNAIDVITKLNDKHSNLIMYLSNVAACNHKLALKSQNTEEKNRLLDEALRKYDLLVGMNKRLLQNKSLDQAGILQNRAEVYHVQHRMSKALADGRLVLEIMKENYYPPHIQITLATERLAHYHLKIGKAKKKELDENGDRHLEQSVDCYDDVLHYIREGGLPLEHKGGRTFRMARDNHKKALMLLKYSKKDINNRMRKYQEFQDGKYNKKIQKNLIEDPDFITEEFLQEARESGETFMPRRVESDSDTTETESEDSESESCSEETSIDESSDNEEVDKADVHIAVFTSKRRDSGIEEEDDMGGTGDERDLHNDDERNREPSHQNRENRQPCDVQPCGAPCLQSDQSMETKDAPCLQSDQSVQTKDAPCLQSDQSMQTKDGPCFQGEQSNQARDLPCHQGDQSSRAGITFQETGAFIPCISVQNFSVPSTSLLKKPKSDKKSSFKRQEHIDELKREHGIKIQRQDSIDESAMDCLSPTNDVFIPNQSTASKDSKTSEDVTPSIFIDKVVPVKRKSEFVRPSSDIEIRGPELVEPSTNVAIKGPEIVASSTSIDIREPEIVAPSTSIEIKGPEFVKPSTNIEIKGPEIVEPSTSIKITGPEIVEPSTSIKITGPEIVAPSMSIAIRGPELVAPSRNIRESTDSETSSSPSIRKVTWSSYGSQDSTFGDNDSCVSDIDSDGIAERRKHLLSSASSQGSVTSKVEHMLNLGSNKDSEDSNDSTGEPAPKLSKLDEK